MILVASLTLLQASPVVGVVAERTPQLDEAHACLAARTDKLLEDFDWEPQPDERWRWATKVVDSCKPEIEAAARTAPHEGAIMSLQGKMLEGGISKRDHLRTEALYFVDRRIAKKSGAVE